MKFKANTRRKAIEYEKDWVQRWKADKTFEKSVENRSKDNSYVFYDGPPFISGNPHHGTLLSSIVKDAIPRYQTMKGKRVERVWGWDCHGLPAERFTEKKLGINSREEVFDYGLEKYIIACRNNMVQTSGEWEDVVDRIGRWVDFKGAYKTMDKDYMESVWWAFKELYDKGKIYEGEKVLMYCTLDATPLSKAEVTMDAGAYQDVTDPSVYVKFKLKDDASQQKNIQLTPHSRVLFVCCENIGRSQMARVIYNQLTESANADGVATGYGKEFREGTIAELEKKKTEELGKAYESTAKLTILEKLGIDISDAPRNKLSSDMIKGYDLIVNMAEHWQTPGWLVGENVIWWDIKDPGMVDDRESRLLASRSAFIEVEKRVKELVDGKIVDDKINEPCLLAWTTTPWTLPANTAVAVNEKLTYVEVEQGGERLILAKELLDKVMRDEKHHPLEYTIIREFKGKELVGRSYEPLFVDRGENAHKVWSAPYVSHEDGTGIVHIAPAYGEEDFVLAKENGIPIVHTIDENGLFTEGDWTGENVWATNKTIAKDLHERGVVWKIDYIRHSYPHCHRCGTKLMYRAHPSWFMDIDCQREQMLEENGPINWFPPHVKNGRFAKTVEQAPDWNLSRDRFWATAMPVWKSESGKVKVVGSYAELKELSGVELADYHRPWIDDVTFSIDGEEYHRIDKVIDCWFESGSMPFAQFHYPFENKQKFEENFPGDFIVEYIGQVRAWFYYVHAVNVALFGTHAFKNVIVTGNVAGNDGRKMSKSYGNYTDPNELMDKFSADSLRYLLLSSPLLSGEDFALQDKEVGDVARKLSMIWNMYDFFTLYAEADDWQWDIKSIKETPLYSRGEVLEGLKNPLDIWIISRLHQLVAEVEKHMDAYNLPDAMSPILPFIDDASNWFVRRSRRRFWKSEDDDDKAMAYRTLHYVLVRLAYVLAPFTPFLAEELYHNLTGDDESIHLKDWLPAGRVDELVMNDMETVRGYVNEALSLRAKAGLKVRQPLSSVTVPSLGEHVDFVSILTDEVNVKEVKTGDAVKIDETLTPELKREGLMREVIRYVQAARKNAGLNVDDRIILHLATDDEELKKAIDEHADTIQAETLAVAFAEVTEGYQTEVNVEKAKLTIALTVR
ncbi:class I tRNA ligase family protein [Candidatus Saccharibacteria bacterium]|nr:MAG: class I tRNA ligase family protein [Candidatus Saccharibacteria bacterium]